MKTVFEASGIWTSKAQSNEDFLELEGSIASQVENVHSRQTVACVCLRLS